MQKARKKKMKVYELVSELLKMPAGAEVEFSTLVNVIEYADAENVDLEDGIETRRIGGIVTEVEQFSSHKVVLRI